MRDNNGLTWFNRNWRILTTIATILVTIGILYAKVNSNSERVEKTAIKADANDLRLYKWDGIGIGWIMAFKDGNVGIGTLTPAAKLAINGGVNVGADTDPGNDNLYVVGNCSALTFTDRTSFYKGDALAEIKNIKAKGNKIDHSSLPDFVRKSIKLEELADPNDPNSVVETIEEGRDLGAMVSMLTVAVQQLTERIEELEKKQDVNEVR